MDELKFADVLFPPMRTGAGLMAVLPQQQVHQSQSQSQGQPQAQSQPTQAPSSHGRPNSLPSTPVTHGLKRLEEDPGESSDAKRYAPPISNISMLKLCYI